MQKQIVQSDFEPADQRNCSKTHERTENIFSNFSELFNSLCGLQLLTIIVVFFFVVFCLILPNVDRCQLFSYLLPSIFHNTLLLISFLKKCKSVPLNLFHVIFPEQGKQAISLLH